MIRKKVFGAAPFGVLLLLGAPLAMAQISPGQTTESAPINYANETLAKKDDDDRHPTRYLVMDDTAGNVIDIVVPINVGTLPTDIGSRRQHRGIHSPRRYGVRRGPRGQ